MPSNSHLAVLSLPSTLIHGNCVKAAFLMFDEETEARKSETTHPRSYGYIVELEITPSFGISADFSLKKNFFVKDFTCFKAQNSAFLSTGTGPILI